MLQIEVAELIQKFAVTVVTNVRIAVKVQENVSKSYKLMLSHIVRKPVIGVSDQL